MLYHHTKNKGDLGVLHATLDLFNKGWLVCEPKTEHAPFDLVIWKDGVTKTVQVKYREIKRGIVTVRFQSCWSDTNGIHMMDVNKNYIDVYCIYCPDTEKCYYLDPKRFDRNVSLRMEKPKNNMVTGVNFSDDFLDLPI
jgi:hypothetical protein